MSLATLIFNYYYYYDCDDDKDCFFQGYDRKDKISKQTDLGSLTL